MPCFKILPFSSLSLDVLLHPWPTIAVGWQFLFSPLYKKKKWEESNSGKSWRTEHLNSLLWPKGFWFCEYLWHLPSPKTTVNAFQIYILIFQGILEIITFFLFCFHVWIPVLNTSKILQHTHRVPVKPRSCRRTFLEGADPSDQHSTLCPCFAKLPGSAIIIIKVNDILCHVIPQLTK